MRYKKYINSLYGLTLNYKPVSMTAIITYNYARKKLSKYIDNMDNFIYADTDSIKCEEKGELNK